MIHVGSMSLPTPRDHVSVFHLAKLFTVGDKENFSKWTLKVPVWM